MLVNPHRRSSGPGADETHALPRIPSRHRPEGRSVEIVPSLALRAGTGERRPQGPMLHLPAPEHSAAHRPAAALTL